VAQNALLQLQCFSGLSSELYAADAHQASAASARGDWPKHRRRDALLRPAVLLIVGSLTSLQQLRFILSLQCVIQGCGRCVLQLACCLSCREKFTRGDENVHCIFFQL